jgi:hypothetical protein
MIPNSAKVVAELDATLRELQLAQQKTAADGHDNTTLKGGDDGDTSPQEGARLKEMKADTSKMNELSHQKVDGTAKSPVTGTAASVGTAEDAKSDNKTAKKKADDPGTSNPDLATKTAACLALGDELLKLASEAEEPAKDDKKVAPAVATAKKDIEATEALKKEAAAVAALLPEGADLQKCAGVPDLPSDEAGLQKVASDVVATYIQKCAEAYADDKDKGFAFGANFHAGLAELEKHAAAADAEPEVAAMIKLAEEDAANVAQLMGGMEGEEGEGGEGDEDGDEGAGAGAGDGDGDEGAAPAGGGDDGGGKPAAPPIPGLGGGDPAAGAGGPPGLGGGDPMAAGGGITAEQILQALQAAGIDPSMLAKTAAVKGLDENVVLATLATIKSKKK